QVTSDEFEPVRGLVLSLVTHLSLVSALFFCSSLVTHHCLYSCLPRESDGFFIACVHVAGYADAWIVGQHAIQPPGHFRSAIGHGHLSGVERVADAASSAVMERDPACPRGGVQ